MITPVILLTFANDKDNHLELLEQESRRLELLMQPWHDKKLIELYIQRQARLEDIYQTISRYKGRVSILHYGGHANSTQLCLHEEIVNAHGIAGMLREQAGAQLQLVFLNGCSTRHQVKQLLNLGVKAVIATSVPVADNKATLFSAKFYQALANKYSIQQAFEMATAFLEAKFNLQQEFDYEVTNHRGVGIDSATETNFPWGLYLGKATTEKWDWKLPQFRHSSFRQSPIIHTGHYLPNEFIPPILPEMLKYRPAIRRDMYTEEEEEIDQSQYPAIIIRYFPLPIGVQIQKLVSNEDKDGMNQVGFIRLKQIVSTYSVCLQFTFFILISELWEERRKKFSTFTSEQLLHFLSSGKKDALAFNFFHAAQEAVLELQQHEEKLFIRELAVDPHRDEPFFKAILNQESSFHQACNFLEQLRIDIGKSKVEGNQMENLCSQGEKQLAKILKGLSFLCKYRLLTVRDIELFRPRFCEGQYQHHYAHLNLSAERGIKIQRNTLNSAQECADSGSVILVKNVKEVSDFLSLSPFVIDRYVFVDKYNSNIYLYGFRENEAYIYLRANSDIYKAFQEPADHLSSVKDYDKNRKYFEILTDQLQMFQRDFSSS